MHTYIIYACPVGTLAEQLKHYFARSLKTYGANAAHHYMPHCTLTGFFHDEPEAVAAYTTAITAALGRARATQPTPPLVISAMLLREDFHGLLLDSPWLKTVIADVAQSVDSLTREDALRLKAWLHLSIAYAFPPEQHAGLAQLAREMVDMHAPVRWEVRFYERHATGTWTCHAQWPLDASHGA